VPLSKPRYSHTGTIISSQIRRTRLGGSFDGRKEIIFKIERFTISSVDALKFVSWGLILMFDIEKAHRPTEK
jgi:hypothetical protein